MPMKETAPMPPMMTSGQRIFGRLWPEDATAAVCGFDPFDKFGAGGFSAISGSVLTCMGSCFWLSAIGGEIGAGTSPIPTDWAITGGAGGSAGGKETETVEIIGKGKGGLGFPTDVIPTGGPLPPPPETGGGGGNWTVVSFAPISSSLFSCGIRTMGKGGTATVRISSAFPARSVEKYSTVVVADVSVMTIGSV